MSGKMTAREAARFAGCSVSTLKRYTCGFCGQQALAQLMYGCGAVFDKCDPTKDKQWPPHCGQRAREAT